MKIKIEKISELAKLSKDINVEELSLDTSSIISSQKMISSYDDNGTSVEVYQVMSTYSFNYSMTATEWDSSYAISIWVEGLYEKRTLNDGSAGYRPTMIKGKVLLNSDPSQLTVTKMDFLTVTALGKFNLDGSFYGQSGYTNYNSSRENQSGHWNYLHYELFSTLLD